MHITLKERFLSLSSQLSPENLCCDGELRGAALKRKEADLRRQWHELEKEAGQSVSEEETWAWHKEVSNYRTRMRQEALAKLPGHRLLITNNPGTWSRKATEHGRDGQSAYYIRNESMREPVMFADRTIEPPKDAKFELYSEFGFKLHKKEKIGEYDTLEAAVEAAEVFLRTVSYDSLKAALPLYREENLQRELARLPRYY
jgi:hypothetical protein